MDPRADELLTFWFRDPTRWFARDDGFDDELRRRFGAVHEAAVTGALDDWAGTPRGALALVLLIDQLSRNLHRDSPRAFAADGHALAIARAALAAGHDRALGWAERTFLLLPFMHAEDAAVQDESVQRFRALRDEAIAAGAPPGERRAVEASDDFARRHAAIVHRFGRYPHRNRVLGRTSTAEELEFLQQPGSSFG